ncbi:MAG: DUF4149 domain-containing protein [Afipia sp.]|nr:DUF4149 domain-containing protein [Afipia sp.]
MTATKPLAILMLASAWAGFLIGVSFLATPVKFLAPSLTLPVALDVGRQTFTVFNRCEIALAIVMLLLVVWERRSKTSIGLAAILALIVLTQTIWMLSVLDTRVETILQGGALAPSSLHTLYIIVECVKLALLVAIASVTARMVIRLVLEDM